MDEKPDPTLTEDDFIVSKIINQLASHDIRYKHYPETPKTLRRASVLLPVAVKNGEIVLLLTKRSQDLRTHASHVSFPGGTRDDSDASDIDTALREAEEEIGLPPSCVKILAVLNRGIVLPNIVVCPVVGLIPSNFQPKINKMEVESTFYIPLKEFLSSQVHTHEIKIHGQVFQTQRLDYDNGEELFKIFGFTALHSILLARIVFDKNAEELEMGLQEYFLHFTEGIKEGNNSKL